MGRMFLHIVCKLYKSRCLLTQTQSHVMFNVPSYFDIRFQKLNPESRSSVVVNAISRWLTYLDTVGKVEHTDTQRFIFYLLKCSGFFLWTTQKFICWNVRVSLNDTLLPSSYPEIFLQHGEAVEADSW